MKKLKCAVIGAGYLGKFHAEKYASLPDCELVAVVDVNEPVATRIAANYGARACTDYKRILGEVDAVSIVVPTTYHHAVAKEEPTGLRGTLTLIARNPEIHAGTAAFGTGVVTFRDLRGAFGARFLGVDLA